MPGYLRTHPITTERIADAQNRAASLPYKQHPDSPEFQLVRAKLRAEYGDPRDAVQFFQSAVRERRFAIGGGGALRPCGGVRAREAHEGSRSRARAGARRAAAAGR